MMKQDTGTVSLVVIGGTGMVQNLKTALFVGVDPSIKNTGLAILDNDCNIVLVKDGFKSTSTGITRYTEIAEKVLNTIPNKCFIAYEDYSYNSIHKAYSLAEFGGILKYHLLKKADNLQLYAPNKVKLFATGNGLASKKEVAKEMFTYFPELDKNVSDDITDALTLALMCYFNINQAKKDEDRLTRRGSLHLLRKRLEVVYKCLVCY